MKLVFVRRRRLFCRQFLHLSRTYIKKKNVDTYVCNIISLLVFSLKCYSHNKRILKRVIHTNTHTNIYNIHHNICIHIYTYRYTHILTKRELNDFILI